MPKAKTKSAVRKAAKPSGPSNDAPSQQPSAETDPLQHDEPTKGAKFEWTSSGREYYRRILRWIPSSPTRESQKLAAIDKSAVAVLAALAARGIFVKSDTWNTNGEGSSSTAADVFHVEIDRRSESHPRKFDTLVQLPGSPAEEMLKAFANITPKSMEKPLRALEQYSEPPEPSESPSH
ncbi:uncharacterized protein SPPG_08659 [Spizellomyces punctatus DAOM BR117]|uniref:Uncharacterized protein n=1 Tax=Spizellomyces punctatus (strain DAOM BR117) TaxID=645134 RepID=A0A0L0H3W6_SPIPD|nr:uncharacterized protein SPPG_08659 [Spizellomyces punctatus DAOM BR117]KNC95897.1 hypothetical protein SPPG_08659 [Spizellomyces punctatus DAOM BR117]|eukprot:XP_016603937.1 hypothetical protein SPPG_08659 [Spizellomyces punctatus DAOM BR117]